jgi:Cu-Zn family superoxide dismutase
MNHQCVIGAVAAVFLGGMTLGCSSWETGSSPAPTPDDEGFLVSEVDQELANGRAAQTRVHDVAGNVIARVAFVQRRGGETLVAASVTLPPGPESIHGFHIHANTTADGGPGGGCTVVDAGDPAANFLGVGGHFNPTAAIHGQHAGDMPALFVGTNGRANVVFTTDRFKPADVIGRAVIIHAGADNYANIPVGAAANQYTANSADAITLTNNTGNAGARIGCGIIR